MLMPKPCSGDFKQNVIKQLQPITVIPEVTFVKLKLALPVPSTILQIGALSAQYMRVRELQRVEKKDN